MTRYEQGFLTKCAEYGVDGRPILAGIRKQAGRGGAGRRILDAIKRFYTKPGELIHSVQEVHVPGGGGYYASAGGTNLNDVSKMTNGKIRWGRILATLGLGGAAAAGGTAAAMGGSPAPALSPAAKASLLAALGIGGAAAGVAATSGDDDDKKKKDKKIVKDKKSK